MYIFSIKELLFYLSELNTVFSVVDPLAVTLGKKIKSLIWYVAFDLYNVVWVYISGETLL